jgi:hypothetical protein
MFFQVKNSLNKNITTHSNTFTTTMENTLEHLHNHNGKVIVMDMVVPEAPENSCLWCLCFSVVELIKICDCLMINISLVK